MIRINIKYLLFLLCLFSLPLKGQNILLQSISIQDTLQGLYRTLHYIEKETGTQFHYSSIIEPEETPPIAPGTYVIKNILDSLLDSKAVNYIEVADAIVISPKKTIADYHSIAGKIISQTNNKPVPFCNIYIKNKPIGTLSNYEGNFRLNIPDSLYGDTIVISSIGYNLKKIPVDQYTTDSILITLKNQRIPIKFVLVRPTDARKIITQAKQNLKSNYSTQTEYFYGYFRESNKQNDKYIAINEAIVNIIKHPCTNFKNDLVSISKGRKGENIEKSKIVNMIVEGGLYNCLRLDLIKHPISFFDTELMNSYTYWVERNTIYQGRSTYIIGFKGIENSEYAHYLGRIYIDIESLAIARFEFELSHIGLEEAKSVLVKKVPFGLKVQPVYGRYVSNYRYYENQWHFSDSQSEVEIKVKNKWRRKNLKINTEFTTSSNLVITGISTKIFDKDIQKSAAHISDVFVNQINNLEDKFWEGNNIIIPEEPMQKTLRELQLKGIIGKEHNFISVDNTDNELN